MTASLSRSIPVLLALASCAGGEMSPRDYCEARQAAWERAFPELKPGAEEHRGDVDSCVKVTTDERATGEYAKRLRCLREAIKGGPDPKAEYMALGTCEGGGPQPVSK